MTAKNKNGLADSGSGFLHFSRWLALIRVKPEAFLVCCASFLISALVLQVSMRPGENGERLTTEFEEGKVAERDFIAEYPVSYVDREATYAALEEAVHQLHAVFRFDEAVTERLKLNWNSFVDTSRLSFVSSGNAERFAANIGLDFGGGFQSGALESLYSDQDTRDVTLDELTAIFNEALSLGIFKLDGVDISRYHPEQGELLHNIGQRTEREIVQLDRVLTLDRLDSYVLQEAKVSENPALARLAVPLLEPFLGENVFFSSGDTELRLAQIRAEPVMRRIERGDRVIRKGFIVTADDIEKLAAFTGEKNSGDILSVLGQTLAKILVAFFLVLWGGKRMAGRSLRTSEVYLLCGLSLLYFICVAAFRDFSPVQGVFPVSILFPTAICVMLPSFLIGHRVALVMAVSLPAGAFFSGTIDANAFVFALASGAAASLVLHNALKRMDIVKAGVQIAAVQLSSIVAILLTARAPLEFYPANLFWSAFNGIASGMLVLGILPLLENLMNAATSFRLIELSDVNAPTLKRLFTVAPGTYSHSMMVAHLAEAAAQEIGANALLARVGAYYHDIGKMEQPDYFVENQGEYNKHNDIAPRLSATVLRSHVKFGVEKARALGLPGEIIDIIAEHHGNSLIRWFYDAAVKREGTVNREDFCYPGTPPHTRESAVVMLADVTEAASRTLEKPSVSRLEKFIGELIEGKIAGGQLSESDMTFRDLETVKKTFVRVLAGYYHSRIEYPKDPQLSASNSNAQASVPAAVAHPRGETKHE